jgi:hypothetical protein
MDDVLSIDNSKEENKKRKPAHYCNRTHPIHMHICQGGFVKKVMVRPQDINHLKYSHNQTQLYMNTMPPKYFDFLTHLGWSGGIGLGPRSVLLLKVLGSILFGANLGGLI